MNDLLLTFSCVLLVAFVIGMALSIRVTRVGRTEAHRDYSLAAREREQRPTYTNEEILLPGVDIRHSNVSKQIARARSGHADDWRRNYLVGEPSDVEVVDGEIVDEPPSYRGTYNTRQLNSRNPDSRAIERKREWRGF